jgi:hypothetical protein
VGCDSSKGFLTKIKKTSLQLKLELQRTYLSIQDIKNGLFSFQVRLVRTNKFQPHYCSDLHKIILQVHDPWKLHHLCFI